LPKPRYHVLVCTNVRPPDNPKGSCGPKGAEELVDRLKSMVRDRGLDASIIVNRTSCLKHCSQGVTMAVQPDNVWYAKVKPEDLEQICTEHLQEGRPIDRLQMPDVPWE
jgi:(2Fe-2S) ferredoxin